VRQVCDDGQEQPALQVEFAQTLCGCPISRPSRATSSVTSRTARQQSYPTRNYVTLSGTVHNKYGTYPEMFLRKGLSYTKDGHEILVILLARALFI
jgi:hypothetical protein